MDFGDIETTPWGSERCGWDPNFYESYYFGEVCVPWEVNIPGVLV